ncbi:MAG: hypothetical protein MJ106_04890 [Lentisphaeria bacterium]|nr:hypothetical protein [Lentisphaeria bacterium]
MEHQAKKGLNLPPGWHYDEDTGTLMRDVIHRMGRRCRNWDYSNKADYLITIVLEERSSPILGRLVGDSPETATIELSPLGMKIQEHIFRISEYVPEIEIIGVRIMPEHIHFIVAVKRQMSRPLGAVLRGFKGGASKIYWEWAGLSVGASRRKPLFAAGYVDNILHDEESVANAVKYMDDNPRRLWEKRAHPELFRVLRDLEIPIDSTIGHFEAIGNEYLLKEPTIFQVQCSRRYFEYRRSADGRIDVNAAPMICTAEYIEKRDAYLESAKHGAVLISPCLSHGEKEIVRLAFEAGHKVIALCNKGFSSLYKPGGKLFDKCAAGNLLLLAPAAWPYVPGEKKITRADACVLNRIAQWLARNGAIEINYHGREAENIDDLARRATKRPMGG